MSECTHDCSTCGSNCSERTEPQSLLKDHNPAARVGKVYGVVSGKGGVGKSMVTSQLAVMANRAGLTTGILDADITGPSIPKAFGVHERAMGDDRGMLPVETKTGIQMMSVNLLLDKETDPVLWRGPVIGGVVTQFWTDVVDGGDDEHPYRGRGGEHELCPLPRLRQGNPPLRPGQDRGGRPGPRPEAAGQDAH